MRSKKVLIWIFFIFLILSAGFISSYISSNVQYSQYTPQKSETLDKEVCQQGQDFLIQISPFGCTPAVVRTDLLEENDVPVYCQLGATKINPLIDVKAIDSISFSGTYPKEIAGLGFHPAKAALGVKGDLNSPVLNNIGYLVLILKKQANASAIPDFVSGTLTAKIKYNINNAFGIGNAMFYLPQLTNEEWKTKQYQYSFWGGRGSLRADSIEANSADISLYSNDVKISEVSLEKGKTSDSIYLPGFTCQAGLKLRLDGLENPDTRARLRVNAEVVEVAKGEKFLENKCQVQNINKNGLVQRVSLKCQEDSGSKNFDLSVSPKIILYIDGENKSFGVGDWLYDANLADGQKSVYLGYIGTKGDSGKAEDLYIYLFSTPQKGALSEGKISSITSLVSGLIDAKATSSGLVSSLSATLKVFAGASVWLGRFIANGEDFYRLDFSSRFQENNVFGKNIFFVGFAESQDIELSGNVLENYQNAKKDYDTIRESYSSEKFIKDTTSTFGEEALYNEIVLAWDAGQKKTAQELCKEFEQNYPNSKKVLSSYCNNDYQSSNSETSSVYATINKQTRQISFDGIYEPSLEEYGVRVMVTTPSGGTRYFDLTKNRIQYLGDSTIEEGKEIFTLPGGTLQTGFFTSDLYFTYSFTGWIWSADKENWMDVSTTKVKGGSFDGQEILYSSQNRVTLESLVGKTYDIGKTILTSKGATASRLPSTITTSVSNDYIQLVSLDDNSAGIKTSVSASGVMSQIQKDFSSDIVKLTLDSTRVLGEGYSFTLSKINLKKTAKVSVIPNIDNSGTQANFSFKIGIEKRAINLPPEKVKQMIKDLDKDIKQWDDVSTKLGGVVEGLKTSCIVTGAALVATNFIANAGGTGIARKTIMRGADGWYEKCADLVAKGTYSSQEQCFNENSDKIDNDVAKLSLIINSQNSQIKQLESGITTQQFLTDSVIDTDAFMQKYAPQVSSSLNNLPGDSISNGKQSISKSEILPAISYDGYKQGTYNTEQLRNIELYTKILSDSSSSAELKDIANSRLYSELSNIKINAGNSVKMNTIANNINVNPSKIGFLEVGKNVRAIEYKGLTNGELGSKKIINFPDNTPIYLAPASDGKTYIFILDDSAGTSQLQVKLLDSNQRAIYDYSDLSLVQIPPTELTTIYFQKVDASSYKNQYKNAKLRYYETEPYKGLPAIVPFDVNNGWYAATKQTLPTGGNIRSYDASARVNSFYLCNVGVNRLEEFQTIGDDSCEMINTGTGQSYNQFPGLSESESKSIVNKAVKAIEQASKMYKSGLSGKVKILDATVDVGSPAVNTPQYECQDFMSPKDCLLLFNLCDPVICPSSRCDLGGAYPVKDVVQSGIIGSLVLCLPNINEGIVMPVCLTGIKAGIDGFVSIKQAYKDCLQESLDTGKLVGICDEIYSIYLCDFFWRQALPLADMVIPKVMEMVAGQNVKGGGEYLSVSSAWSGAQQAIDYFVNNYGVNAKNAFLARSSENVGEEVCKLYTSAVYPSGGEILNKLSSPDSPAQFNGRFDEISLTTTTAPPTSHYKVFYHIYAGKDSGAYYKVYLKGSLDSSYYKDTAQSISVASGYVTVGGYASETKDFIATSGYNQLCINVNGQEECGFKEVSTSFAVNYIKDEYVSSQASQTDIRTESECISGTASAYSLLNPNTQSAAEEIANPEIYNAGIIRVCATGNPGSTIDPYAGTEKARWKEVGYCDNQKIKCWIDTQSVESVIKTTTVEGETLNEVTQNYLDTLANQNGYLTKEQFSSAVQQIENTNDSSTKITMVNTILNKSFWSSEKVQLLYLRGNAYAEIFRVLFSQMPKPVVTNGTTTSPTGTTSTETTLTGNAILTTAKRLAESGWNEQRTSSNCGAKYECINGNVCARFVLHVMIDAGVRSFLKDKNVPGVCSQEVCKIENGKMIFNKDSWSGYEGIDGLIPKMLNSGDFVEINKDYLVGGDIVILGLWKTDDKNNLYDKKTQHAVIFDSYSSDKKRINSYGDPGRDLPVRLQSFAINPAHSPPQEGDWYIYRAFRFTGNFVSSTGQTTAETTTAPATLQTINEKIYEEAVKFEGSTQNSAQFVSQTLINAGISWMTTASSVSSLISSIETNNNFAEVNVNLDSLQAGDVILLGKGCVKDNIGIYHYSTPQESNKIYFYSNINGRVLSQNIVFSSEVKDSLYVYRAYRYAGSSVPSDKVQKTKLTIDSALTEVNNILKTSGKKNGGKYSDNKKFVDELIFDGVLEGSQCSTMRGVNTLFGMINTEQDMNWLKKILLEKKATPGQAESVSAD